MVCALFVLCWLWCAFVLKCTNLLLSGQLVSVRCFCVGCVFAMSMVFLRFTVCVLVFVFFDRGLLTDFSVFSLAVASVWFCFRWFLAGMSVVFKFRVFIFSCGFVCDRYRGR